MAVTVETVKASIDTLSANLNENVFVVSAREAFRDGINEYEISDEEKAKLIAQYEAQVSIGIMGHIINLAKEIPQVDAQVNLLAQQKLTEVEQTAKVLYEHKSLMPSQKAQVDAQKTLLLEQEKTQAKQTLKVGYESMETKARTSKNYGFNVTESLGVFSASDMKNGMIDKQIISEMWRHRDMKAGVLLKNKSVYTTLKNAKFEEARTHIAIKANQDNMYLKKADYKVNQLNAMAVDEDYIIGATQIEDVKSTIDAIPTTALTYTSDISTTFSEVEVTDITL